MKITIATLKAAGLTRDQILAVIEAAEAEASEVEAETREGNRIRKRNQRARANVTRDACDKRDIACIDSKILSSSDSLTDSQETQEVVVALRRPRAPRASRGTQIDINWIPPDEYRQFARAQGWDETRISAQLFGFRDHALQKGRVCKDWFAAWRNWVRSPYQAPTTNGGQNGNHVVRSAAGIRASQLAQIYREQNAVDPDLFDPRRIIGGGGTLD